MPWLLGLNSAETGNSKWFSVVSGQVPKLLEHHQVSLCVHTSRELKSETEPGLRLQSLIYDAIYNVGISNGHEFYVPQFILKD